MAISLDPGSLSSAQMYDLLVGTVQPRPIAFVSTISALGEENLAPFSFFMVGGTKPPSLAYSPTTAGPGKAKDSLRNVEETGEFVVNLVTKDLAEAMNATAFDYPAEVSEWRISGLTAVECEVVRPKRVRECPVSLECRLFQIIRHGEGAGAANYVIGEVVRVHLADELWTGSGLAAGVFRPMSRMGGREYLDTRDLEIFEMARPSAAADSSR